MNLLSFDIGGTSIKHSIISDENNSITISENKLFEVEIIDYDFLLFVLSDIYSNYKDLVYGISVSLPGFIDVKRGIHMGAGPMDYLRNKNLEKDLSEMCGCLVKIGNDGKCAALAELQSGNLKGCGNGAAFIIGTGVGGGLVIDGKILNGKNFTAGEFSFLRPNNILNWSDRGNTVGDLCSTRGLISLYMDKKEMINRPSGIEFFKMLENGDENAQLCLDIFAQEIAKVIQNLNFLLDLEKVVIGGGIANNEILIKKIKYEIDELYENGGEVNDENMKKAQILPCYYKNNAGMVGSFYLFKKLLNLSL